MKNTSDDLTDIFEIKTANEWIRGAKSRPVPKRLFGEFWLESELAILFADTGVGKSLLAVQIAESIARGRPMFTPATPPGDFGFGIADFGLGEATPAAPTTPSAEAASTPPKQGGELRTVPPQKVLYLDFELSDKQFEMRYAGEHEPERGECLRNHYRFSDRFLRVVIRPEAVIEDENRSFETVMRKLIEPLVKRTGARVLIIDNITYLKRTAESTRETARLMKELKRLKEELGLSILVLAHTPKRDTRRGLSVNDLAGSKILANFADSIFAIGKSRQEAAGRYIKHIKARSIDIVYGAEHLPVFSITRLQGNFLGFTFRSFAPEAEHLQDVRDQREWETIDRIKRMAETGMTIREIAEQLDMSKTTAHRLLQMWRESGECGTRSAKCGISDDAESIPHSHGFYGRDRCIFVKCAGCSACGGRAGNLWREQPGTVLRGHDDCPDDCTVCGPRPYRDDDATVDPELKERSDRFFRELKEWLVSGKQGERPMYDAPSVLNAEGGVRNAESPLSDDDEETDAEAIAALCAQFTDNAGPEIPNSTQPPPPDRLSTFNPQLSIRLDGYGREIHVETEDRNGKPMVWYNYDNGTKYRNCRKGFGIIREAVAA